MADPTAPSEEGRTAPDVPASAADVPKAPWHFKLLVVLTVLYLGWRFVELFAAMA